MSAPTSRPILFNGPMVRAILEGRKTQTRRLVKPQPHAGVRRSVFVKSGLEDGHGREIRQRIFVGDSLWARETWKPTGIFSWAETMQTRSCGRFAYKADADQRPQDESLPWRPSIFMPRWASRLTLKVTGVRIQTLHAISEEDAKAEGIDFDDERGFHFMGQDFDTGRACYAALWNEINGPESWNQNPWVWAYTFEVAR